MGCLALSFINQGKVMWYTKAVAKGGSQGPAAPSGWLLYPLGTFLPLLAMAVPL
jgi:hypothetical protein